MSDEIQVSGIDDEDGRQVIPITMSKESLLELAGGRPVAFNMTFANGVTITLRFTVNTRDSIG
jgi:hypothetical protein